jgi:hypothetical protein
MTKTYKKAMENLNLAAYAALRAAGNEEGAPVDALCEIAAEIDSLIDHGVTLRRDARHAGPIQGCKAGGVGVMEVTATYSGEEVERHVRRADRAIRLRGAKQPRLGRSKPRQRSRY